MQGPYNIVHSHWVVNMIKMRFVHTQLNIIKCKNTSIFHIKENVHFTFLCIKQDFGQNIPLANVLNSLPSKYIFQSVKKMNRYFLQKLSDTRRIHDLDHSSKRNILVDATQLCTNEAKRDEVSSMISVETNHALRFSKLYFLILIKNK